MLGSFKLTIVLLSILVLSVISSTLSLRGQQEGKPPQSGNTGASEKLDKQAKKEGQLRGQFPVVDYDAPDDSDSARRQRRAEKSKRFDKKNFVSEDPTPRAVEFARVIEGYDVPALPTSQSGLIITGEVLSSRAYLSNDKGGIYTELTFTVSEVIKNTLPASVASGDVVTVQREGGIVRYNNGHQRLYHLAGEGMPTVGKQYVLFLRPIEESEDFYVITAYELSPAGVVPVDEQQHFKAYEGYDVQTFLNLIHSSAEQSQQEPAN